MTTLAHKQARVQAIHKREGVKVEILYDTTLVLSDARDRNQLPANSITLSTFSSPSPSFDDAVKRGFSGETAFSWIVGVAVPEWARVGIDAEEKRLYLLRVEGSLYRPHEVLRPDFLGSLTWSIGCIPRG